MKHLPFSTVLLSLIVGISACTPAAELSQSPLENTSDEPLQGASTDSSEIGSSQSPAAESLEAAVTDADVPAGQSGAVCDASSVQSEMNLCAQESYQQSEQQLDRVHQSLKRSLSDSGQRSLVAVSTAWAEFLSLDCAFSKNQYAGGSIEPLIYSSCLEGYTEARIAELQQTQSPQLSYQAADTQLNDTYQRLLAVLSGPEVEDVTDIQLAWIEYRDRNCAFETLYAPEAIKESQCLARMSEIRTAQLEEDIDQRSL